jgi:hypothetical protein
MKMEEMLWIEEIVESTKAPPFLPNSRVDMASFVDHYKVVAKRISTLPSARNGGESKDGAKSGRLKCQFSQVEGNLDLQKIPKLVPILGKRACGER